jgi:hypothetical protein
MTRLASACALFAIAFLPSVAQVTTSQYNNFRTGALAKPSIAQS